MEVPLNVLILEDRPADAELMVEELREAGFAPDWRRVDTERDYLAALNPDLDVILADHSLPQYDSVQALERLNEHRLDVPFIVVSGTINEELAVALMKHGAADYILKDRIARLGQAVVQALQQRHLREGKRNVERALTEKEEWYRALTENLHDCIVVLNASGKVAYTSSSSLRLMGYDPVALIGSDGFALIHPDDLPAALQRFQALLADPGGMAHVTVRSRHANGSWHWLEVVAINRLAEPPIDGIILTYRDVTESKKAEEALVLFRTLLDQTNDAIEVVDPETGRFLDVNEKAWASLGYTREEFLRLSVLDVDETITHWPPSMDSEVRRRSNSLIVEGRHRRKDGSTFPVEVNVNFIRLDRDYVVSIVRDITERKKAEAQLLLQGAALEAAADSIVITDRQGAIAWVNKAYTGMTGYSRAEALGQNPRILKSGKQDASYYQDLWSTILAEKVWRGELVNRRRDGSLYTEEMTITPVSAKGNGVTHFVAIKQDVTERKKTEAEKNRLVGILEATPDYVGTCSMNERGLYLNRSGREMLGIGLDEQASALRIADSHPAWAYRLLKDEGIPHAVRNGHWRGEAALRARDGREIPVLVSLVIHKSPAGEPEYLSIVAHDISDRKRAEQALRDNLAFQSALLGAIPLPVFVRATDGRYLGANTAYCEYLGREESEIIGRTVEELFPASQAASYRAKDQELVACPGRQVYEGQLAAAMPGLRQVVFYKASVLGSSGNVTAIVGAILDVTELRQAERSLRASEERFSLAVEGANDGIWDWNLVTKDVYYSPRYKAMIGFAEHEIESCYSEWKRRLHPDDVAGTLAELRDYLKGKSPTYQAEFRMRCKDGSYRWILARAKAIWNDNGKPTRLTGSHTDITERKKAERELRSKTAFLEAQNESSLDGLLVVDDQQKKVLQNRQFATTLRIPQEILDEPEDEATLRFVTNCMKDPGAFMDRVRHLYAHPEESAEEEIELKDGRVLDRYSSPVLGRDGKYYGRIWAFRDITESKKTQANIIERGQLAALTADIGISLTEEASLGGMLQCCAEALVRHGGAAFARIWTLNAAADTLELQASAGLPTHIDGEYARVPVGKFDIGLIAQERKPHLTNHAIGDPRIHDQEWARREGMVAFAGHPLVVADKLRGVIAIFARHTLSENTLDTLAAVANQVALGVERKQAEDQLRSSEERFRRITTNMLDIVTQTSLEGVYEYVTPSVFPVLGLRPQDLIGQSIFAGIHPDDLESAITTFKTAAQTDDEQGGQFRFQNAHEEYVWLEATGKRVLDDAGQVCGILVASRDVTIRRQAQDEIRQLNADLEQKVRDRTAQLESANKELESFAYSVSHDLRAPLRGIDGFSQALLEDYSDKLDAEGQDYLRRVRAASQRMGRLIDDILQLSRMTRSAMNRENVDLSAMAARVVGDLQVAEPGRHIEVCLTPGLIANGDARLLEVVLVNLLGNAWKFTSKTDDARIEFGVTDHEGLPAYFVRDNGAGFDMAYADRLFGAFQRLHSNEEFPGTGIGLATVQRIIRNHGGKIWAQGEVGKGAAFFFTLGSNGDRP